MKTAISLQAGNGNPGDSIANLGGRGLFHAAVSDGVIYDTWYMAEPEPIDYSLIDFYSYEYGLVLCTPWIWDQCAEGVKYGMLRDFIAGIDAKHRFAIGTGSSFHLDHDDSGHESYWGERAVKSTRTDWLKFEHITCRDRLAFDIFSKILGSDRVTLMPCPSFYIASILGVSATRELAEILVYCEIDSTIFWKIREDQVDKPVRYQDELVYSGVDVLVMIPRDFEAFRTRYGREPTHYARNPVEILKVLSQYSKVISARVHACMPGLSLGLDVEIIPLDTRALTAVALGARPIVNSLERAELFADPIHTLSLDDAASILRSRLAL